MPTLNSFESSSLNNLIFKMSIPSMIGMCVIVIYNLADTFFVGQTHNPQMLSAVGIATPLFMILIMIGSLLGVGGSALISEAIGQKNIYKVKQISAFTIIGSLISGIVIALICCLFTSNITSFLGASNDNFEYTKQYVFIIGLSAPFTILSCCLGHVIRGEGNSKLSMYGNIIGTFLNIILDPILILYGNLGVFGAALATLISNVIASLFYLSYILFNKHSLLLFKLKDLKIKAHIALSVINVGLPVALTNLLVSVSNLILNKVLMPYGSEYIASMGVCLKVLLITTLLQVGLSNGVLPIMSYMYGSNNYHKYLSCFKKSMVYSIILGCSLALICYVTSWQIIYAFCNNDAITKIASYMLKIMLISAPIIGIYNINIACLQASKKLSLALFVSSLRQGIVFLILIWVLPSLIGFNGIILTQPLSDIIAIIIALVINTYLLKKGW